MMRLSPGIAYGCFELLEIVSRNPLTFPQIHAAFAHLGSIPAETITETAQRLNWLCADDKGIATVTVSGQRLLAISGYEPMLRQALLDYVEIECPPWLQNASFGRARVLSFASSEIVQLFAEAGLTQDISDEVIAFWDELAARARGQKSDRLTVIGRQGERLTIAYEEARTGRKPKWVAIENNEDGYDVLSIVASDDSRLLSIEVKASTLGMAGSFYLTRHEWERSGETDNHVFHLWAIQANTIPRLAVITPSEMQPHIPRNLGQGNWERVKIPLAAFKTGFRVVQPG